MIDHYKKIVREMLTTRYNHSMNTGDMCVGLARKYGMSEKITSNAYIGGILHDIMKERPQYVIKEMAFESGFEIDPVEMETTSLWHGIAGAKFVRDELEITDSDILSGIRYHTVARAGMSSVEKLIYIADKISIERKSESAAELRVIAFENLDLAVNASIKMGIKKCLKKDRQIPAYTIAAYNYYSKQGELK